MNDIANFINSVGFPIFACIFVYVNSQKEADRHKDEVDRLSESLDNNTSVMNKLLEKIGGKI